MKMAMAVIGRGRQDAPPLPTAEWGRYQVGVMSLLVELGEFYRAIPGMGVDINDTPEEQATILGAVMEENVNLFREKLDLLRIAHDQAAVILTVGDLAVIGG